MSLRSAVSLSGSFSYSGAQTLPLQYFLKLFVLPR